MNLSAPKKWTFIVGVVLWLAALLLAVFPVQQLAAPMLLSLGAAYWLGMLGGLVLILGSLLEGF
jgi:hypothetical protein